MNVLYLEATQDTPKVFFNKNDGIFELSGRSLPEDSVGFYTPIIEWIKEYAKTPNPSTVFSFKLKYFNTSSSKLLYDLLDAMKGIKNVHVQWSYNEDDEDILDAGKEFEEQIDIPFEFKVV